MELGKYSSNYTKESRFNTAVAQMERIAKTQELSNEFQFNRDFVNWGKTIELLYKEVRSKCKDKEKEIADNLLSSMNKEINGSNHQTNNNPLVTSRIWNVCWNADVYVRDLMEHHKLGSPDEDSPLNAAYEE